MYIFEGFCIYLDLIFFVLFSAWRLKVCILELASLLYIVQGSTYSRRILLWRFQKSPYFSFVVLVKRCKFFLQNQIVFVNNRNTCNVQQSKMFGCMPSYPVSSSGLLNPIFWVISTGQCQDIGDQGPVANVMTWT